MITIQYTAKQLKKQAKARARDRRINERKTLKMKGAIAMREGIRPEQVTDEMMKREVDRLDYELDSKLCLAK